MVNDEELLQGFSKCRDLGALPQVRRFLLWVLFLCQYLWLDVTHMENTSHNQLAVLAHVDKAAECMPRLAQVPPLNRKLKTLLAQVHAENGEGVALGQQVVFDAGVTGPEGHALSRPAVLEGEATARAIKLASFVGVPLYVVHVMSTDALEEVRRD